MRLAGAVGGRIGRRLPGRGVTRRLSISGRVQRRQCGAEPVALAVPLAVAIACGGITCRLAGLAPGRLSGGLARGRLSGGLAPGRLAGGQPLSLKPAPTRPLSA
jgi:hypothetical protein